MGSRWGSGMRAQKACGRSQAARIPTTDQEEAMSKIQGPPESQVIQRLGLYSARAVKYIWGCDGCCQK